MARVSPDQLALPAFDLRPLCPLCKRPALLGQWSPFRKQAICRDCSEAMLFPEKAVVYNAENGELEMNREADYALLEARIIGEERIREASRKRPHYISERDLSSWPNERQLSLPVCHRCGCVHDRRYSFGGNDFQPYCQRCDDELEVETYMRLPQIIETLAGGNDPETVLDYLFQRRPELFERNVLPDYLFSLMKAKETV